MTQTEVLDRLDELSRAFDDPEKGDAAYLDFLVLESKHRDDLAKITDRNDLARMREIYMRVLANARNSSEKELAIFFHGMEAVDGSNEEVVKTIKELRDELSAVFDEIEEKLKNASTAEDILLYTSKNPELNQRLQSIVTRLFEAFSKKTGIEIEVDFENS